MFGAFFPAVPNQSSDKADIAVMDRGLHRGAFVTVCVIVIAHVSIKFHKAECNLERGYIDGLHQPSLWGGLGCTTAVSSRVYIS